jgi:hypothetical protein
MTLREFHYHHFQDHEHDTRSTDAVSGNEKLGLKQQNKIQGLND